MSSRFDTPETERERKKKDWSNGWRLNYEPGDKSVLDDTFKMLRDARHGKQSQEQDRTTVREYKPRPRKLYYNEEGRAIPPGLTSKVYRRKKEEEETQQ